MNNRGVIWLADTNGFAYTVSLEDNKLTLRSEESNIIKRISAVQTCAFAIGGDQDVYVFVNKRDVPIRVQVSTYENQRWAPIHKWSEKSMFPTDRWSWSSQDGTEHTPKDSFHLPENWEWEDNWYIDQTVPGDEKGWQYALDFPREYGPVKEWKSCVRRRCWARYRRFVKLEKWIKLSSPDTEELVERAIQDMTAGGMSIPGCEPGFIALWAVNFAGKVLYRQGISSVCPEGTSWVSVELPEEVQAGQISVGPTGMVWMITWQGNLYLRTGISKFQPTGLSWISVAFPYDRVYQLSVGTNALWLLTMEGKVYFRRGISSSIGYTDEASAKGTKWVEMVGTFSLLSVALNDQVFALSTGSDHVYFRSDVTSSELSGKEWKNVNIGVSMNDSMSSLSSDSSHQELEGTRGEDGTLYSEELFGMNEKTTEKLHWNWMSCGSCNVMADFFNSHNRWQRMASVGSNSSSKLNLSDGPWRGAVLELLESRDNDELTPYYDYEQAVDKGSWSKSSTFRMLQDKRYNIWCNCKVTLASEADAECLIIDYEKAGKPKEMKLVISDITCICRVYNQTETNCFAIHTAVRTMERNSLLLSAMSEKELNEWVTSLNTSCQKARKCEGPPKASALWCTTSWGDVFFSDSKDELDFTSLPAYHIYWRQVGGHLSKIEAGADHVVWGLGYDGKPWCFTRGFGGGIFPAHASSAHGIYEQSDQDVFHTYENERWNPLEGFGGRRFVTDRYEWSDETGVLERRKEGYPLHNCDWQWEGEWKVDYNTTEGTDKKGWMYALDFPREYSCEKCWNDCVRRRRWLRSARVNTTGPWVEIFPSLQLKDVSIQIDRKYLDDGCVAVWAVNYKGDVLCRKGVTAACPQGTSWHHVTTNTQFMSISVGCNYNVWGVGVDGAAYLRVGYEGSDDAGKMWERIPAPGLNPLNTISVGKNTVWTVDKFGEHYYREGVTETFPEGTKWLTIFGRVQSVSVGANDEVWVKCQGGLEKCFNTTVERPTGRGWVLALPTFWRNITTRAVGIETDTVDEACLLAEATAVINIDDKQRKATKHFETIKESSYKELMESGDIYSSCYGGDEEEFIPPNSDSEGEFIPPNSEFLYYPPILKKFEQNPKKPYSLALKKEEKDKFKQFVKANPSCIAAVPYHTISTGAEDSQAIVVYLYIHTSGMRITDDFREEAKKIFSSYEVKFVDLEYEQLGGSFCPRDHEEESDAEEMTKVARIIEKSFAMFKNRLNVTAVYPSYKISGGEETNEVCVAVAVLGKGNIPVGEKIFPENAIDGYKFDIVEGYFVPTGLGYSKEEFPLRFGASIGVKGAPGSGSLGALVTDGQDYFILSCNHVLEKPSKWWESDGETSLCDDGSPMIKFLRSEVREVYNRLQKLEKEVDDRLLTDGCLEKRKRLDDEKPSARMLCEGTPVEVPDEKSAADSPSEEKPSVRVSDGEKSQGGKRRDGLPTIKFLKSEMSGIENRLQKLDENGDNLNENEKEDLGKLRKNISEMKVQVDLEERINEMNQKLSDENGDDVQNEDMETNKMRSQVRVPVPGKILIEQPSAEDYVEQVIDLEKKHKEAVNEWETTLSEREEIDKKLEGLKLNQEVGNLEETEIKKQEKAAEKNAKSLEHGKLNLKLCAFESEQCKDELPRCAATYVCGGQGNFHDSALDRYFFVDAGIAIVTDDERDAIRQENSIDDYKGYKGMKYSNKVVPCEEMEKKAQREQLRFWKRGRTTGVTKNAQFRNMITVKYPLEDSPSNYGNFKHIPFRPICPTCSKFDPHFPYSEPARSNKMWECNKCGNDIPTCEMKEENWALNCFMVQSEKVFVEPGDSGAVVFDERQGAAWAIVVGTYRQGYSVFTVTSSLDISLKFLKKEFDKDLKLCIKA